MDRKIKITIGVADIGFAVFFVYFVLFSGQTITSNYDVQQLIAISAASGAGIVILYWKWLREHNPELVKLLELLLYLIPPTVASIPLLAKVNYFLISIVCFLVPIGWFNFGLLKIGTLNKDEEKKTNKETMITICIMTGILLVVLVIFTWVITMICAYQCKNP